MREFFLDRRRNLGFVMLVLSCVLMAGWIRSEFTFDAIGIAIGQNSKLVVVSSCGLIEFDFFDNVSQAKLLDWASTKRNFEEDPYDPQLGHPFQTHSDRDPFHGASWTNWTFSIWSVLLPLTLLSTWLLVSRRNHVARFDRGRCDAE